MIDQFQFVLFVNSAPPQASELISRAFPAVELEEFRKLPNQGSFAMIQTGGFTAAIQCQINRVDLVVDRPAEEDNAAFTFIEDADLADAFAVAAPAIAELCSALPVVRGAVIITRSQEMESTELANADVLANVPNLPHPAGASDIDYRVNVPIQSALDPDLRYNRVARWFSARRGIMALVPDQRLAASSLINVSILSADVNVSPEHSIESYDKPACFQEMYELAADLLDRGMEVFQ